MDRVRQAVQDLGIAHAGDPSGGLTISAGISVSPSGHRKSSDQVLKEADTALYAAKAAGRNTIALARSANGSTA